MEVFEENLDRVMLKEASGRAAGALFFIPLDLGISYRVRELIELVPAIVEEAELLHLEQDGTTTAADAEMLREIEEKLCLSLNRALGVNTAQEAFAQHRPFSTVDGELWASVVVRTLSTVVLRVSGYWDTLCRNMAAEKSKKARKRG